MGLPEDLVAPFQERLPQIRQRLQEFSAVSREQWFYELCYCLLTPQSKAANAEIVVNHLQQIDFQGKGADVVPLLRDPAHYIRFHHQKAHRLQVARERWPEYERVIALTMDPIEKRDLLAETVLGFGLKEASHYLRNIGTRGLGILDRHLLRYLVHCGLYAQTPDIASKRRYRAVESRFKAFAAKSGLDMDELDLFFWSEVTGFILK